MSFQVELCAAFLVTEHAVHVLASHVRLEEKDGGKANPAGLVVVVLAPVATIVAPEFQFAVLALDMTPERTCCVEATVATVVSAYIGWLAEMGGADMTLKGLMLSEAQATAFVIPAAETVGTLVDGGMSPQSCSCDE